MKKTIYKFGQVKDIKEIKTKPITLEQLCDIKGYEMVVYDDTKLITKPLDEKWTVDIEDTETVIFSGTGSTQLKAMSNLVDEINKTKYFLFTITLGRKGWIKRN